MYEGELEATEVLTTNINKQLQHTVSSVADEDFRVGICMRCFSYQLLP